MTYAPIASEQRRWRCIESETKYYNEELAGGKWKNIMTAKGNTSPSWTFKWPQVTRLPNAQHAPNDQITLAAPFSAPMLTPRGGAIANPPTFAEKDGYVSISAEHFTRNIPRGGAQWQIISGLGRTGDSVAVYPTTVASIDKPENIASQAPELDYDLTSTSAGDVDITTYNLPTRRINDARQLRYAIAIDNEPPQIVDFNQETEGQPWMQNVARNAAINSTRHKIDAPGKHTLKVWMVDPGVVMEKVVINAGGAKESYFGPPETAVSAGHKLQDGNSNSIGDDAASQKCRRLVQIALLMILFGARLCASASIFPPFVLA